MFEHGSGPTTRTERRVTLVTPGCPGTGVGSIDSDTSAPALREAVPADHGSEGGEP